MNDLLKIILISLAQTQAVYLAVDSSLAHKLKSRLPKLPNLLKELWDCPVCTGFWISLILCKGDIYQTLAVGFLGSVFYELKKKYAPCEQCTNKADFSGIKITR